MINKKYIRKSGYNIGKIKCRVLDKNVVEGFILKRDVTVREAKYILSTILGFYLQERDDFEDEDAYRFQNSIYANIVNQWLRGQVGDATIMEYAWGCRNSIGIFNMIPLIKYLKSRNII